LLTYIPYLTSILTEEIFKRFKLFKTFVLEERSLTQLAWCFLCGQRLTGEMANPYYYQWTQARFIIASIPMETEQLLFQFFLLIANPHPNVIYANSE